MSTPESFAALIRIVGRGQHGSRGLTAEEAEFALCTILKGQWAPEQVGALLMLMRVRGETPEEIAGFARAARNSIATAPGSFTLDWPSYAGKRRRLPWFLLSAKLLGQAGKRVLLHGADPEGTDRMGISGAVDVLEIPVCLDPAAARATPAPVVFMPLHALSPALHALLQLRRLLGLRSPIHTTVRMLNPLAATWSLQSVFHPNYLALHVAAACALQDARVLILKGEAGEFERDPGRVGRFSVVRDAVGSEHSWAQTQVAPPGPPPGLQPIAHLRAVWDDQAVDPYGIGAVLATCALILHVLDGLAEEQAHAEARRLWEARADTPATPARAPLPPQ